MINQLQKIHTCSNSEKEKIRHQAFQYFSQKFDQTLSLNIANPAGRVKTIYRLKIDEKTEDQLIERFLGHPLNPTKYTMAMQGRPIVFRIEIALPNKENLSYLAEVGKVMDIKWPEEPSSARINLDKPVESSRPIAEADNIRYKIIMYPYHLGDKIKKNDYLETEWRVGDKIDAPKGSPDYLSFIGGLAGISCGDSFKNITNNPRYCHDYLSHVEWPIHIRKIFKVIQERYEQIVKMNQIGRPIYTTFDPTKPARGFGHITEWNDGGFTGRYFLIPEIKVNNPNHPLQLIHKNSVKRIAIPASSDRLEIKERS